MKNYFSQLMKDGYELLISKRPIWPYELSTSQKVELMQTAINYFKAQEEYEKCSILQKKIVSLMKPKKTRRKIKKSYDEKENSNWD